MPQARSGASMVSLPAPALTVSTSLAPSAPVMETCAANPLTVTEPPAPATWIWSLPPVPVTVTRIGRTVAGAAAGRRAEVERDLRDAGLGQIADRDVVGAAESREVDVLDAVDVHRDVGDVAGEPPRVPLAVMLMFSLMFAPLNCSVSVPSWPSTVSLPSPGFQTKVSSPAPSRAVSLPRPPVMTSLPSPPSSVSAPSPPVMVSLPVPPSIGELDEAGETVAGGDDVVAAVGVDHDILGGADIEGERRGVDAIEAHARAVGGDRERFGAVAAVDFGGVVAVAAFEQVGAVAGIPDHAIVAGLAEHLVVAVPPVSVSLPSPPNSRSLPPLPSRVSLPAWPNSMVVARAAGEDVVAVAAEQIRRGQRAVGFVHRNDVIAALAEHLNQGRVGDGRRTAQDRDGAAVDENVTGRISARYDRVVEVVAELREDAGAFGKCRRDSHAENPFVDRSPGIVFSDSALDRLERALQTILKSSPDSLIVSPNVRYGSHIRRHRRLRHTVLFHFSDYVLDTGRRELRCGDRSIEVEPQVLDLLIYLMQNNDRVITKDDLIDSVWGGRIVSDTTLTSRIYAARRAIGDSGRNQTTDPHHRAQGPALHRGFARAIRRRCDAGDRTAAG